MKFGKRQLTRPLSAQLEITNGCNHKCIHCYLLSPYQENRPVVESSEETVLACAQKLVDAGIFFCTVTGGEPMTNKNLMKKVIKLFVDNNVMVSVNTNITLLDDSIIQFLKDKNVGVLTSCPSSISGHYNKLTNTNNYSLFEDNLKKLTLAGIRYTVNMVVVKENLNDIVPTALRLAELGCKSFGATPASLNMDYPSPNFLLSLSDIRKFVYDLISIKKDIDMSIDIIEALPKCCLPDDILSGDYHFLNRKCLAGRLSVSVSSSGEVRPCGHNSISYGNLLVDSIESIYSMMQPWRNNEYIPDECKDCSWLNHCNGGCRTNAYAVHKNFKGRDIWMTQPIHSYVNQKTVVDDSNYKSLQLTVNQNYRYRKEYRDTYTIFNVKSRTYFMLNVEFLHFIKDVAQSFKDKIVTYNELVHYYNAENNKYFDDILHLMYKKGLLMASC